MGDRKLAELLTDTLRQMQTKIRVKQGKKPYDYWLINIVAQRKSGPVWRNHLSILFSGGGN